MGMVVVMVEKSEREGIYCCDFSRFGYLRRGFLGIALGI